MTRPPHGRSRAGATAGERGRPARSDVVRNRQRLVDAARQLYAERGLDVTLDDVARHAGLGVGTIYRHFPSKELLIEAVFRDSADQIVAIADHAAANPDSWDGLVEFLTRINDIIAADRGLRDILLRSPRGADAAIEARTRIGPTVESLIARAKADGHLRPDTERTDLFLTDVMVDAARHYTSGVRPDAWRRYLTIVLDGLRTRRDRPSELPDPPLTAEQLDQAMRQQATTD